MELLIDLQYISIYINNLYPNGVGIDIPTWLAVSGVVVALIIKKVRG